MDNHDLQVENARKVDEYMRDKYTNRELYDWTVSQVSSVYFQSYQLAYDVAKRAERAFRHELGLTDANFVQFGYWDGLQKGLLAGERLHHDLKRMEVAYLDQNTREFEMTKHVSLASLDAAALLRLRQTGECFRQSNDPRFIDSSGAIESIVTSSAQNDSGLFETNLRDERYLPFEGMGVISEWRLELPDKFRQFDYDTISDVILHLRYTGRDSGLKQQAVAELQSALNQINVSENEQGLVRLFSARHEFPSEWHRFLHPTGATGDQTLTLELTKDRFPFLFGNKTITINKVEVFLKVGSHVPATLKLLGQWTGSTAKALPISTWNELRHAVHAEKAPGGQPVDWTLTAWLEPSPNVHNRLDAEAIEDIMIVCFYTVS